MTPKATTRKVEPTEAAIERTEYPHVVKVPGTLGGQPHIDGTGIPVRIVSGLFDAGTPVAEIIESYPWLSPAQIEDAVNYAHDHPDEIADWNEKNTLRGTLRDYDLVYFEGRLLRRDEFQALNLPPDAVYFTWDTLPAALDE